MKKLLILIFLIISFVGGYAFAQSSAMPVTLGFLTTSGCSGSFTSCWLPYSISHPLPAGSN